jgi:ABC-type multidrug transport system ATPase subunit
LIAQLVLENAGKAFSDNWIFRNLNYTLQTGDKLALLGPNGSGKSTLMLAMAGYVRPTEGRIYTVSEHAQKIEPPLGTDLTICMPNMETFEEFSLAQLLRMHMNSRVLISAIQDMRDPAALAEIMRFGRLDLNKQIRFFSNGMRQRLKLGLAIFTDASMVMLDEPLTNLDKAGITLYRQWISDFLGNRMLIVASNRPDEYDMCSRFIHLDESTSDNQAS